MIIFFISISIILLCSQFTSCNNTHDKTEDIGSNNLTMGNPDYEIPLSAYINYHYDDSYLIWQSLKDDIYPDEFILSLDSDKGLMLKITEYTFEDVTDIEYNRYYEITHIYYNNQNIKCEPPLSYSERLFRVYEDKQNDLVIIGNSYIEETNGKWYFINSDGIIILENSPINDGYEIVFHIENNTVKYIKTNYKYLNAAQSYYFIAEAYSHSDEFFSETGNIQYKNGEIIFNPITTYTVNEWYLSDDFYYKNAREILNVPTVDEFVNNLYKLK